MEIVKGLFFWCGGIQGFWWAICVTSSVAASAWAGKHLVGPWVRKAIASPYARRFLMAFGFSGLGFTAGAAWTLYVNGCWPVEEQLAAVGVEPVDAIGDEPEQGGRGDIDDEQQEERPAGGLQGVDERGKRHVVAKPVVPGGSSFIARRNGNHWMRPPGQFEKTEIDGVWRCKICRGYVAPELTEDGLRFVELELAPDPPAR